MTITSPRFSRLLKLDALASGACGVALAALGRPFEALLGIDAGLSIPVGVFLIAYAAGLAFIAARPTISRVLAFGIIAFNALWVVDSVLVLVLGWVRPTLIGEGLIIAQAVVVAILAELQFLAVRRAGALAAARV